VRLLDRLGRQPLVIVAGWIVAAGLAVLVGVVGIGLVGAGMTSRQGAPISEDEVLRALGEQSASPSVSATPSAAASTRVGEAKRPFPTRGGTVVADCQQIWTMAPAQGFSVHEQDEREGEFRGVRDHHDRVKVELSCVNGVPQLRVRGEG
jgi:hypothetical protein